MAEWDGKTERRVATPSINHCDNHAQNQAKIDSHGEQLAGIKSSVQTGKWLIGGMLTVMLVMLNVAIGKLTTIETAMVAGKEGIARLERDVAHLQSRVTYIETRHSAIDEDRRGGRQ